MKNFLSKLPRIRSKLSNIFELIISGLLGVMILILITFIAYKIYLLFLFQKEQSFVHDLIFLLVLVKIFGLLLSYFKTHRVGIKYIIEISVIAPAIEIVFATNSHSPFTLSILLVYSLANLIIYIAFHDKIKKIDS